MKNNESVNHLGIIETLKEKFKKENDENLNFIRKGEIGGWKNVLNQDILGNRCNLTLNSWFEHCQLSMKW